MKWKTSMTRRKGNGFVEHGWLSLHIPRARPQTWEGLPIDVQQSSWNQAEPLWGPPRYARLSVHSSFLFVEKRLQPLGLSLSSKGQIQTIAHQGRNSQETTWGKTQVSRSVVSNSLQPRGLQHVRPPCPSPTPGAYSNSCPLSRWCHPTMSFSVIPFSSCLQSFPASGSFPVSRFFTSGGQRIGISASASVLPMNIQDWFTLGLTGWDSQESSPTPPFKSISSSALSFLYSPTLTSIHDHWKSHSFD